MITLAELLAKGVAGWDSDRYNALLAATGSLSAQVIIQQYGPTWEMHDLDIDLTVCDAVIAGGKLVRLTLKAGVYSLSTLDSENSGDKTWTVKTSPGLPDSDVVPAMCASGGSVRIFYYDSGSILYKDYDVALNTYGAPVSVAAVAGITHLAPATTTRCYVALTNANSNRVLGYYDSGLPWTWTASDVFWPYPIDSLDAARASDGSDRVVAGAFLPPLYGSRVVGTTVSRVFNLVSGVLVFAVNNGRWSEYRTLDVIDNQSLSEFPARRDVRLTYLNGWFFLTYWWYRDFDDLKSEEQAHSYMLRSRDGLQWEQAEEIGYLPQGWNSTTPTAPMCILPLGNYLYSLGRSTFRSPACLMAGMTPVEQDVTQNVLGLQSGASDIRGSTVELANPISNAKRAGELADTLATLDARSMVVYHLGYQIGADKMRLQVSIEDVLDQEYAVSLPRRGLRLKTQDVLNRINRSKAYNTKEWDSQEIGLDTFHDDTATGYGGLRFLAGVQGAWQNDKTLDMAQLTSSNEMGLATSTFVTEALNASISAGFQVNYGADHDEYAGLSFRVLDKDNFFHVAYYGKDNTIRIYRTTGGTPKLLASTAAPGANWAVRTLNGDVYKYLRVTGRGALVQVQTSNDGVTWTVLTFSGAAWVEIGGMPTMVGTYTNWAGRWGLIGYGFSEIDVPQPWLPDPWEPPVIPPVWRGYVFMVGARRVGRSHNFFGLTPPTWDNVTPPDAGLGTGQASIRSFDVISDGQAYCGIRNNDDLSGAVWYCSDLIGGSDWVQVATQADGKADAAAFLGADPANCVFQPLGLKMDEYGSCYAPIFGTPWNSPSGWAVWYKFDAGVKHIDGYRCGSDPGTLLGMVKRPWNVNGGSGVMNVGMGETYWGGGRLVDMVNKTEALCWSNYDPKGPGQVAQMGKEYFKGLMSTPGGSGLWEISDPNHSWVYAGVDQWTPIHENEGDVFFKDGATGNLSKNGVVIANRSTVFGNDPDSGGFTTVNGDSAKIIWTARWNFLRRVVYSENGFASFVDKSGDFATAVGTGSAWDDGDTVPMVWAI